MAGTDPLRLYIYHEGLTRFATEEYHEPTPENIARSYIHLTNYSLNKSNPNYVFNSSEKVRTILSRIWTKVIKELYLQHMKDLQKVVLMCKSSSFPSRMR